MKNKVILSIIAVCCVFLVGCSSGGSTTPTATATAKTPLQLLNESVSDRFESMWTALNAKATTTDLTNLANRVGTLETWKSGLTPTATPDYSEITTDIGALQTSVENNSAEIAYMKIQLNQLLSGTSPTPTPTPTVQCGVQRPTLTSPAYGGTINAGTVNFQWNTCTNAIRYEFYLGTTPSVTMVMNISAPFHSIQYPASTADTYYYWKVVSVSPCGDKAESDGWWFKTQ